MTALIDRNAEHLVLRAKTASDLMTPNPLSLREQATLADAIQFLTSKGFSAAPVIDDTGRPVGVLSRADIVVHDREAIPSLSDVHAFYGDPFLPLKANPLDVFPATDPGNTLVADVMTPVVYSVAPETPVRTVIEQMVALRVHRLFVVDRCGTLIGVISVLDVLRHLDTHE
jgi:CBS domain-containing protein